MREFTLFIIIAVVILLFFSFRAVVLWYFKIDKIVENQIRRIVENQNTSGTEIVLRDILSELRKSKEKIAE